MDKQIKSHPEMEDHVKENLGKAYGMQFCGVYLEEMTREELISSVVMAMYIAQSETEELKRRTEYLLNP